MTGHESEWIEREALADLHAAAADVAGGLQVQSMDIDGSLVSISAALPASAIVINRTLGCGLAEEATKSTVTAIVDAYDRAGVERFFLHHHPDARPEELPSWYREAGLVKVRGWQKFERDRESVASATTDLSVRLAGQDDGEDFARIVCNAFDLGDKAIPWLARLPGRDNWHVFMSFDDGNAAGAGALFVKDGIGWTDFGATAPEYRRRGSQSAVLAARIEHALDLGCQRIHTCTGEAVEDDPQHSYRNIEKARFRRSYVRENYAPY